MPATLRFPFPTATAGMPPEADQIIELLRGNDFAVGGEDTYADIRPWKLAMAQTESPIHDVVIEFVADNAETIGDGTLAQAIGLYGVIGDLTNGAKTLLGVLGLNLGQTMPQVPIVARTTGELVGFSQIIQNVAPYDGLSVGAVSAAFSATEGTLVTITARPIRRREYMG